MTDADTRLAEIEAAVVFIAQSVAVLKGGRYLTLAERRARAEGYARIALNGSSDTDALNLEIFKSSLPADAARLVPAMLKNGLLRPSDVSRFLASVEAFEPTRPARPSQHQKSKSRPSGRTDRLRKQPC